MNGLAARGGITRDERLLAKFDGTATRMQPTAMLACGIGAKLAPIKARRPTGNVHRAAILTGTVVLECTLADCECPAGQLNGAAIIRGSNAALKRGARGFAAPSFDDDSPAHDHAMERDSRRPGHDTDYNLAA